ncbi:MAG: response regulator [Nitrospirae bacterium]|nr:response regulator [Nitrospirota bacterium]
MKNKILIVDSEPDMLLLLSRLIMEVTHYKPVITNNPLEGLELARKGDIDLVIAELKLPLFDGTELIEALKGIDEDIPVIIMSAYGTAESALEVKDKGGFDFIKKPFRKDRMLFAVDKALQMAKLKKENRTLREMVKTV